MNLKLSGLALAISAALTVGLSASAQAHEGRAHAKPGHSFEDASRPGGHVDLDGGTRGAIGGGQYVNGHFKERYVPGRGRDHGNHTPPIPEPETYAMMLAGLGLLGAAIRRRRQK